MLAIVVVAPLYTAITFASSVDHLTWYGPNGELSGVVGVLLKIGT